jgi:hypothetical protein
MGHQDLAPYTPRDYGPGRNDVVKGPHRDGELAGGLLAVIQEALICGGPDGLNCARDGRFKGAFHVIPSRRNLRQYWDKVWSNSHTISDLL